MAKKLNAKSLDEEGMLNHQMQDEEEEDDEEFDEEQEDEDEETPRDESEEEGSRIERSKVTEDTTIFDEVFDGKKQKRVEQKVETKVKKEKVRKIDSDTRDKEWEKDIEVPSKEEIKEKILRKAASAPHKKLEDLEEDLIEADSESEDDTEVDIEIEDDDRAVPLKLLEDGNNVFIGRKKNIFEKYGYEGALHIGRIKEEGYPEKEVYLDGLNPHVVFICGSRGSGKCLEGNTLITLEDGTQIPIKELELRNEKVLALNHELKIEKTPKTEFFKRTVNKLLEVKLRSGKKIKLTPEHPLLTINGWRPAEELKKGARIATPRILEAFGNKEMKECDVKLLAYLIAEGHLSNQFVLFSNFDEKIISEFMQSIQEFDEGLRVEIHSNFGCFRVAQKKKKIDITHIQRNQKGQFNSESFIIPQKSSIMQWLESIGLYGKLSAEKFIPEQIFQLKKEQLAVFLNRMFSCDGTIHRINKTNTWSVSYASSSEQISRQVQHLLLRFGINSRLRSKKIKLNEKIFNTFELVLYGENVIKFIQEIGFFGEKEKKQTIAIEEMLGTQRNPNTDTIPIEVWNNFKPTNWAAMERGLGYSSPKSMRSAVNYAPSRDKLFRMAQFAENKGIQLLAQSDIFWDEIVEVNELIGEIEVYDISVPELHNFVANDIIVHNSYIMGIIAEELAKKNKNVGMIVVDPIGVFWSMKFANKEEKELEALKDWGLKAEGLTNLKVFIPDGMRSQAPKTTYDATFAVQPSLLTVEDWCLTFGMDRFGPTGLLMDKLLKNVSHGYKTIEGKYVKAKKNEYSLDSMIECLETDGELNSSEKGYKMDSIRALVSRFEAAKTWGVFSDKGTPLAELSRENQLTILDTSFLEDNVTALVIGILARRILAARKLSTRKEAVQRLKTSSVEEMLELDIPATWLFIDEAHTLVPSGNYKTAATDAIIEYVKQGRRPGCSLVFATQQPSAINSKVLSQLDVIIAHKLIFDDDIKAVYKRTPTIIPHKYKKASFIKTLPIGVALTGDRQEETSRAFVLRVRPRKSQHEGREAETVDSEKKPMENSQLLEFATQSLMRDLKNKPIVPMETVNQLIEMLNNKYKGKLMLSQVLDALEDMGMTIEQKKVINPALLEEEKEERISEAKELADNETDIIPAKKGIKKTQLDEMVEGMQENPVEKSFAKTELTDRESFSLPKRITLKQAEHLVDSKRQKKFLGLFGKEEQILESKEVNEVIYKVAFHEFNNRNEFVPNTCFISSRTGEFVHFVNNKFVESTGLSKIHEVNKEEADILKSLLDKMPLEQKIKHSPNLDDEHVREHLEGLAQKGYVLKQKTEGKTKYSLNKEIEMPTTPRHSLLASINSLPITKENVSDVMKENFSREEISQMLQTLFPNVVIKRVSELYRPMYLIKVQGEKNFFVDAFTGSIVS
ncbi:MAG: DUF853 family protein [archaeon]|nr:DUF853 family protein [archaeon]